MRPAFTFRVNSKGVIIDLNPDLEFIYLKDALIKHVSDASEFFAGVDMYLNVNGRKFEQSQLQELMDIVSQYEKVKKIYFISEKTTGHSDHLSFNKDTILIKGTIRSGKKVQYPTNIVVMGDINPGAEVIAGGDVIVLGKLKGVVHAGAGGTSEAQVVALKLQPTQLRIGSIISRPPDEGNVTTSLRPEKAFIKDNAIVVEELSI